MEVTLEFAVETGTKADNNNEYSMMEIRNVIVSLPGNLSNNNKRPMALSDELMTQMTHMTVVRNNSHLYKSSKQQHFPSLKTI